MAHPLRREQLKMLHESLEDTVIEFMKSTGKSLCDTTVTQLENWLTDEIEKLENPKEARDGNKLF